MASSQFKEEFEQIQSVTDRLVKDANAKAVFIADRTGQLISSSGDVDKLDSTLKAFLAASDPERTIPKQLKETEMATHMHGEGKDSIAIQLVGGRLIVVVIFDSHSSLGLVRLRIRKASEELNFICEALMEKAKVSGDVPFRECTDEDIDSLFSK